MSELLASLARSIAHHWKRSLVAVVLVVVGLVIVAANAPDPPADDFEVPGAESQKALDLFSAHTPALAGVDSTVVLRATEGSLVEPAARKAVGQSIEKIRDLRAVLTVSNPYDPRAPGLSRDGKIGLIDVRYDLEYGDVEKADAEKAAKAKAATEKAKAAEQASQKQAEQPAPTVPGSKPADKPTGIYKGEVLPTVGPASKTE